MVPPILVHWLRLTVGFRFRAWWRTAAFTGRRSAATAGRGAACWSAANRALQIALTLAPRRFECGAAGVKSFGVEHGPFPGCVGCRQADTVFAHAGDELREPRFRCRAIGAGCSGEVAGPAFLQRFLVLRSAYSLRELESTRAARRPSLSCGPRPGGRTSYRWRGQRDALFLQAGSQRRESVGCWCLCAFRRCVGVRVRGARRAASGAAARRQRTAGAENREHQDWPDAAAGRLLRGGTWVHDLFV